MATVEDYILSASILPSGTMEEHLQNLIPPNVHVLQDGVNMAADSDAMNLLLTSTEQVAVATSDEVNFSVASDEILLTDSTGDIVVEAVSDEVTMTVDCIGVVLGEGNVPVEKIAANTVGQFRVVTVNNVGYVHHADKDTPADANQLIGITADSALALELVSIAADGDELTEPTWTWDTELPIYLGSDGVLTQTLPTTGFAVIMAMALTPTTIRVDIQTPIFL